MFVLLLTCFLLSSIFFVATMVKFCRTGSLRFPKAIIVGDIFFILLYGYCFCSLIYGKLDTIQFNTDDHEQVINVYSEWKHYSSPENILVQDTETGKESVLPWSSAIINMSYVGIQKDLLEVNATVLEPMTSASAYSPKHVTLVMTNEVYEKVRHEMYLTKQAFQWDRSIFGQI